MMAHLKDTFFCEDFLDHARIADQLLGHYCQQQRNRECYWMARSRAQTVGDICCVIIDSYDRSKCMLPKYPHGGRSPKHPTYETIKSFLEVGLI